MELYEPRDPPVLILRVCHRHPAVVIVNRFGF